MKREYPARHPSKMRPAHPGAVLRDDVLPALAVSVTEAARELGISRQTLHAILAERAPVTPDMAVRLGKWCGNGPHLWLAMQRERDLWEASERLAETVEGIPTREAA
ncbi:HigA family addiction module antidote protein [Roseomonas eburnea]|uniref:HigA family addiction module antidote protein n=1 Tax=Neoroseomonas eburnea TaxID=1346889 RepID=A0A9X9XET9_9PROT|nr:HigA family addiction module antitoxin [Neoroseomonas eburnea]MBR0682225.1 HigA family addiction module antidote protein [Neoroseomonas eburnea]